MYNRRENVQQCSFLLGVQIVFVKYDFVLLSGVQTNMAEVYRYNLLHTIAILLNVPPSLFMSLHGVSTIFLVLGTAK